MEAGVFKENIIRDFDNGIIKYNDFIKLFGIFEEKNSLGGDLSHGKKQWLDIALASISNPDLVLLDEPTAGLSFEETKKTGEIIKYLNKQGTTFLIVEVVAAFETIPNSV